MAATQPHPRRAQAVQVVLSLILGGGILWWMYRGFSMDELWQTLSTDISWGWMLASLPFGVLACWFRAMRWRLAMQPLGLTPRRSVAANAIFISYASSLVIPRVGEVLRCAVLRRYEGANFAQGIGTVVAERVVDSLLLVLLSAAALLCQMQVAADFAIQTGMGLTPLLSRFTTAGWIVTVVCIAVAILLGVYLMKRLSVFSRVTAVVADLRSGLTSIFHTPRPMLFWCYSIGIWLAYYLHFYVAFFCYQPTASLSPIAALVAFVVGSFAVLVPTPNGAGAWHFATKTVLVLYGVASTPAAVFVLAVHTIQTLLVALLGLYAIVALQFTAPSNSPLRGRDNTPSP